jgi:hypothetical protein
LVERLESELEKWKRSLQELKSEFAAYKKLAASDAGGFENQLLTLQDLLAKTKLDYETELERLRKAHDELLLELKEAHKDEIRNNDEFFRKKRDSLEKEHRDKTDEMHRDNKELVAKMTDDYQSKLETLKNEKFTEEKRLNLLITDKETIIREYSQKIKDFEDDQVAKNEKLKQKEYEIADLLNQIKNLNDTIEILRGTGQNAVSIWQKEKQMLLDQIRENLEERERRIKELREKFERDMEKLKDTHIEDKRRLKREFEEMKDKLEIEKINKVTELEAKIAKLDKELRDLREAHQKELDYLANSQTGNLDLMKKQLEQKLAELARHKDEEMRQALDTLRVEYEEKIRILKQDHFYQETELKKQFEKDTAAAKAEEE